MPVDPSARAAIHDTRPASLDAIHSTCASDFNDEICCDPLLTKLLVGDENSQVHFDGGGDPGSGHIGCNLVMGLTDLDVRDTPDTKASVGTSNRFE